MLRRLDAADEYSAGTAATRLCSLLLKDLIEKSPDSAFRQHPGGLEELLPGRVPDHKVRNGDLEGIGELQERVQAGDHEPALKLGHIPAAEPALLDEGIERELLLLPKLADAKADSLGSRICGLPVPTRLRPCARHGLGLYRKRDLARFGFPNYDAGLPTF